MKLSSEPFAFPDVNVIILIPLDQQLLMFFLLDHVTEITYHLFKAVQFNFEEGNVKSGFGNKLLLSFAIGT